MPGSGKQSAEIQQQIIQYLEAGIDPTTIHRRLKVGRSSIYRMKRCLQQHGTAYAPPETNKKNGRPKVMTSEQEIEIRNWLKDPKNRERFLDDMVWFIHDRFGMVCSTTTCSKIKRKWVKVIEAEERGEQLDPMIAQEQVRQDAFRVGKKPAAKVHPEIELDRPEQPPVQQHPVPESSAPDVQVQIPLDVMLQQHDEHQHEPQIDRKLQERIQSEVASAALRHQNSI